jgi:hypothetical protein
MLWKMPTLSGAASMAAKSCCLMGDIDSHRVLDNPILTYSLAGRCLNRWRSLSGRRIEHP